ncbi:hypothetical protein [Solidesulfovibrio sp.]|uniref:hypothetical protein n=1 Tax=Solidesulfovibrio sp. TaxID=2910990 RepID=UPI002628F86A|nr:hypothetical protein [Solidesulfovibrio sp.]
MGRIVRSLLLWAALSLTLPGLAGAVDASRFDDPVLPGDGRTFLALVRAVFPGIAEEDGALVTTRDQVLRQPGTKERFTLPAGARLTGAEALAVRGDGQANLVVLWSLAAETENPGGGAAVLAIFPGDADVPADVASVGTDVYCDLADGRLLALGPDHAFFIRNHHFNSNQSYLDTGLFHVTASRLRRVAQVMTLSVRGACNAAFEERLDWETSPRPGAVYPDVTAVVRLSPGPGCRKGPAGLPTGALRETYRHDPASGRFTARGKGLAALDTFNERNF